MAERPLPGEVRLVPHRRRRSGPMLPGLGSAGERAACPTSETRAHGTPARCPWVTSAALAEPAAAQQLSSPRLPWSG
jgi:hypothetical protein